MATLIDPLLRRAVGYAHRAPTWAIAVALSAAALAAATATPPLVADAAADRSFTAEVRAAEGSPPGASLDARAVTTGLRDASAVTAVSDVLDRLPVYGRPVASVSPLRPYTDISGPIPVIRSPGGREATAIVFAIGNVAESLGDGSRAPSGIWVPDTVADDLHLQAGDRAEVALTRPSDDPATGTPPVAVTIAGVYPTRDREPIINGFDASNVPGGLPDDPIAHEKPARLLLADTATALALISAMGDVPLTTWDLPWEQAIDLGHGRDAASAVHDADGQLGEGTSAIGAVVIDAHGKPVALHSGVGSFVDRSERAAAELQPLVSSIALTGRVMSALVLAVGTWLLSRNRRREHQLSMSMGIHPARVALTTGIELGGPLLVGVGLAWAAVRWQPGLIAGRGSIDSRSISAATSSVLHTFPVAALLVIVAAFGAVWPLEPSAEGRARRVAGAIHADTVAVVAAAATGVQIVTQRGRTLDSGTSLLFPLFAELAGAVIVVRVAGAIGRAIAARRSRRDTRRRVRRPRSLAAWLATRRAAAWLGELSTLVIVVAAGVGLFAYSTSVASNGQRSMRDKADALGGAMTTLQIANTKPFIVSDRGMPVGMPARSSVLWKDTNVRVGPNMVTDLMLVDPATFAEAVTWRRSFAKLPLRSLLHAIDDGNAATIPVVLAGAYNADFPDTGVIAVDRAFVHYQVVARIAAAPWLRPRSSMMLASAPRFAEVLPVNLEIQPPLTAAAALDRRFQPFVFADAPASAVTPAFRSVLLDLDTIDTVTARRTPAFVAFELSLPYLQIVGIGLLAVALISIVVLGARRRTDLAVEIAMTDRMGIPGSTVTMALAGGAMLLGLIGSIIGIVIARQLVAFMLHRLDPGPSFRPSFDGGLSWSAAVLAVGVVTTVSMLGALFEVRSARRAHVVEVLRAVD